MRTSAMALSLLAFAASALAAPTPLGAVVRAVPNLREVIRNPEPIDSRASANLKALGYNLLDVDISTRETPAIEAEIDPPNKIV
jgi:hypothetical protein